jgi:hypothetical protein
MVREFFVKGGDAAEAFDSGEEVFDGMALAAPAEPAGPAATRPGWNTGSHALFVQSPAEVVGIEPAIGEQPAVAQARKEWRT